jgi:hypothetical protein
MSREMQWGSRSRAGRRLNPSKLRRTAVLTVDGALALGAGAIGGLFGGAAATAAPSAPGWVPLQTPAPTGLDAPATNPEETFTNVACASAVSCAAAGTYDGTSNSYGILDALTRGSWSSVEAPMPSDVNADPDPYFYATDCPADGSCVAVGTYKNNAGDNNEGLIETLSGGVWSASEVQAPAGAAPAASSDTWLKSVSCPEVGSCVALGYYETTGGTRVGLIDTLSNGQWSAQPAPQVPDANTNNLVRLGGVSCSAIGDCVGDGLFETSAGGTGLEILQESGGQWTASTPPLPGDVQSGTSSEQVAVSPYIENNGQSLSCAGGQCELVGEYQAALGGTAGLLEHFDGTTWTASSAPLPSNSQPAGSESLLPFSVSCAPDDSCTAVGSYIDTTSHDRALVETIVDGVATPSEALQPSGASPPPDVDAQLNAVSCLSSSECTAVGFYGTNANGTAGMISTLSGGRWTSQHAPAPNNTGTGAAEETSLNAVACTSRGGCEAAGDFYDTSGAHEFGLLEAYTPPQGYWLDASDGGIFNYGAPFYGSTGGMHLNAPVVGMAATPGDGGYWLVASDGGVFAYGDAQFYGSTGGTHLNAPIVGMAATSDGRGYWLVAADGGIFSYGDALFHGSAGSLHLNAPVVGMAATASGDGYWLAASDGGIFTYGDAVFYGSTGGIHLNKPVVGMAANVTGNGYWLAASDGGIFSFGDALFQGSAGSMKLNKPIVGMMSTFDGGGYWLIGSDGGIFSYGDAGFQGSTGSIHLNEPMVGGAPS